MSGDVQPRKRKDNKKKQKDEDGGGILNDDVNIHLHKEGGTGGNICAKIVFFFLFSTLIVLIGLIIKENQGLTELEEIESDSRYSQIFEGWVDKHSGELEDNHLPQLSHERDDHDLEEEYESEEDNVEEKDEDQSEEINNDDDDQEEDEESMTRSEEETNEDSEEEDQVPVSEEENTVEENTSEEADEQSESQEEETDKSDEVYDNIREADKNGDVDDDEHILEDKKFKDHSVAKSKDNIMEDVRILNKDVSEESFVDTTEQIAKAQDKTEIVVEALAEKKQEEIKSDHVNPSSGDINVGEEAESDSDKEDYEHAAITNKVDYKIKADIDAAQEHLNKDK